ncbi:hypothetical protein F5I97DRAFT_1832798 [Phlebopus sp. FC_14]|nr:hypothetical protein F5I97DRAFT_1832798 [Phlebopus sp. FC_14]
MSSIYSPTPQVSVHIESDPWFNCTASTTHRPSNEWLEEVGVGTAGVKGVKGCLANFQDGGEIATNLCFSCEGPTAMFSLVLTFFSGGMTIAMDLMEDGGGKVWALLYACDWDQVRHMPFSHSTHTFSQMVHNLYMTGCEEEAVKKVIVEEGRGGTD